LKGRFHEAAGHYQAALERYRDCGDRTGQGRTLARALCRLAGAEIELRSLDQAFDQLQLALQVFREEQDHHREAEALGQLGELSLRRGQLTQAAVFCAQSLAIYRRVDQPEGIAAGLRAVGEVNLRRGDYQQALRHLRQALTPGLVTARTSKPATTGGRR
jgi:tetratricopeptide (TPR) repeat protein